MFYYRKSNGDIKKHFKNRRCISKSSFRLGYTIKNLIPSHIQIQIILIYSGLIIRNKKKLDRACIREGSDICLLIVLVPNVLKSHFLIRFGTLIQFGSLS